MILVLAVKSVITAIVRGFRAVVAQSELLWIHSVPQMALKEDESLSTIILQPFSSLSKHQLVLIEQSLAAY